MTEEEYLEFAAAPEGKDLSIELKGFYLDVYLDKTKWHWNIVKRGEQGESFVGKDFSDREMALQSIMNKWQEINK